MITLEQHVVRRVALLTLTVRSLMGYGLDATVRMMELSRLAVLLDNYHRMYDGTVSMEVFVNDQIDTWSTLRDVEENARANGLRYNQQNIDDFTDNIEFLLDLLSEFTVEQSKQEPENMFFFTPTEAL
jgi:hypothetical protein